MDDSEELSGEKHRDMIARYRVELVQSIDPDRQFLFSYLRSKHVLDDEDCELIVNTGASRQQKVSKFLDVLMLKGSEAFSHFVDALEYEHPVLFEKFSGKKASIARTIPSPIPYPQKGAWDFTTGLAGKELIDFDRQYLAKQLEKMTVDFQSMTYVHSKTVKEKNALEQRLQESARELELLQKHNSDLKYEVKLLGEQVKETKRQSFQGQEPVNRYIQELIRENMERSNMVIALQGKLLASGDELEQSKKSLSELRTKNDNLMQQVKELVINYDSERRQSKRLNDKVRSQSDQMKQVEEYKKENYELKFKLAELTTEKDEAVNQLEEFRKVTEALNAKYDLLKEEKNLAMEYQQHFQGQYLSLEQQALLFEGKLREANSQMNNWRRKYERTNEELQTTKEQRDSLLNEREAAIEERAAAIKERDELLRLKEELQSSKTEAINKQIAINRQLESQYKSLLGELDETKAELQKTKNEIFLQHHPDRGSVVGWSDGTHSDSDVMQSTSCWDSEKDSDSEDFHKKARGLSSTSRDEYNRHIIHAYPWRKRTRLDVLKSVYNKLNQTIDGENHQEPKAMTLPMKRHSEGVIKGLMSHEQLDFIFTNSLQDTSSISELTSLLPLASINLNPVNGKNNDDTHRRVSVPYGEPESFPNKVEAASQCRPSTTEKSNTEAVVTKEEVSPTESSETSSSPTFSTVPNSSRQEKRDSFGEEGQLPGIRKKIGKPSRANNGDKQRSSQKQKSDFASFIPMVSEVALGVVLQKTTVDVLNASIPKITSPKLSRKYEKQDSDSAAVMSSPSLISSIPASRSTPATPVAVAEDTAQPFAEKQAEIFPLDSKQRNESEDAYIHKSPSTPILPRNMQLSDDDIARKSPRVPKKGLSSHSVSAPKHKQLTVKPKYFPRQRSNSWTVTDKADV